MLKKFSDEDFNISWQFDFVFLRIHAKIIRKDILATNKKEQG